MPKEWFLILLYVVYIWNRTAVKSLGWRTPFETLTGQTPDISIMPLQMPYRQPVFYKEVNHAYTSKSAECFGYFVDFSTSVDHANTFKILDLKTNKIMFRSWVRLPTKDLPNTHSLSELGLLQPSTGSTEKGEHMDMPKNIGTDSEGIPNDRFAIKRRNLWSKWTYGTDKREDWANSRRRSYSSRKQSSA